jgi:hypothetical protein
MAQRSIARLASTNLPPQFSYRPYVPRKRTTVTATSNAVVTQAASPQIVHGDGTIAWRCNACFASEWTTILGLYMATATTLAAQTFDGYWGEVYEVYFSNLDEPSVQGRLWDLSGQFQVVSVTTPIAAVCGAPGFPVI